ncbi:hypothetical protein [Lederbergia citrea]|uniref:hypothetical protein n=1 Tax=Lederbergia citrea TaxID=2833581 RepID=UPI001BC9147B|nr:hypothetical protein [Lederbergia citrea]MBS4205432.1 hypothetical protein [Lederbergia citrea]
MEWVSIALGRWKSFLAVNGMGFDCPWKVEIVACGKWNGFRLPLEGGNRCLR